MRICLLTYDTPHRKTAQVFMGLYNRGFRPSFLLMPFSRRPERNVLFSHRPSQFEGPDPRSLAALAGGKIHEYSDWRSALENYDYFLVCGSNLIEAPFAESGKVLNVHAGLIPTVRGLDSFKWTIYEGEPIGNTLHRIDAEADSGEVLSQLYTPVFAEDDIHTLALRHYENEIWMLTNFDRLLDGPVFALQTKAATMRMPLDVEREMLARFDAYKDARASLPSGRH